MLNSKELPEEIQKDIISKKISSAQKKEVAERFENMQVDAGEAVGIITAQSLGEPGTQMCVSGNEKVILKSNNNIKISRIGDFVDKIFETIETKREGYYEIYDVSDELLVLGLDENEKMKWSQVSALNRVKAPNALIKIKTRSGRSITATDFHSFVTRKHNKVISIAGKELAIGDRIPVMKCLPENCSHAITVDNYIQNVTEQDGRLSRSKLAKTIPNVFDLDNLFGWFIGAYLSEGHATRGQVCISNINDEFISNARMFIKNIGLDYKEYVNGGFAIGRDLKVSNSLLSEFIISICNTGSYNKKVPDFALNAREEFVSGLLRGYFDGDGNITVTRKMIRASSKSKELIEGIALLLNRFGIFSRISKDKKNSYWICIPYGYARTFLDEIGLDIPKKREGLIKLAEMSDERYSKSLDQIETVSGFDNIFHSVAKKLGMRTRYINNFTKRQKIGKATLFRYIKKFEEIARWKKIDISKELIIMQTMLNSDVIWDEIVKVEYIKPESKYVYDLSVPELSTFTTAEGIVTHNTMRTFHFVGVSELNVTLGLPRIIEVLDARKEPKTPMMNIYLKAPHNKTFNSANKIADKIKEVILEDIAVEFTLDLVNIQLQVKVNPDLCRKHSMTIKDAADSLTKQVKGAEVKIRGNNILISLGSKDIKKLYKLKEKIRRLHVSGVLDISHVLAVKREDEYIIQTYGTNLKKVISLDEVDENRTNSNNLFETYKVFGIEAVRERIVQEIMMILNQEGLNVDIRHIMLIADAMCRSGELKGITRHGITSEKQSVLARASFETPLRHLVEASIIGEEDKLTSVVENIMINQPIPLGTGLPELIVKMRTPAPKKSPSKSGDLRGHAERSSARKPKTKKKKVKKK